MSDRCPWCGADNYFKGVDDWKSYDCGTYAKSGKLVRSDYCELLCKVPRMQPVIDAAVYYEDQWHSNPNLQVALHKLRVAVVGYKEPPCEQS